MCPRACDFSEPRVPLCKMRTKTSISTFQGSCGDYVLGKLLRPVVLWGLYDFILTKYETEEEWTSRFDLGVDNFRLCAFQGVKPEEPSTMMDTAPSHSRDPHHCKIPYSRIPELANSIPLRIKTQRLPSPVNVSLLKEHKGIQEGSREFTLTWNQRCY